MFMTYYYGKWTLSGMQWSLHVGLIAIQFTASPDCHVDTCSIVSAAAAGKSISQHLCVMSVLRLQADAANLFYPHHHFICSVNCKSTVEKTRILNKANQVHTSAYWSLNMGLYTCILTHSLTAALDQLRVVASSTSNDPGPRSRQHQQ